MDDFDRLRGRVRQLERSRDAIVATLAVVVEELGPEAAKRVADRLDDMNLLYVGRREEDVVMSIAASLRRAG